MSQARVRETSAGESGIALLSGSRACSMRSRIAGFCSSCGRVPSARRRAPSTDVGVTTAAPKKNTTSTTVTVTTMVRMRGNISFYLNSKPKLRLLKLHLDLDDLPDYKIADRLQSNARH